jgi:hypothetical protein
MGNSKETIPRIRMSLLQGRKWRPKVMRMGMEKKETLAAES